MKMIPYGPEAYQLFHEGAIALAQVEANGMRVDVPYVKKALRRTEKKITRLKSKLSDSEVMKVWRKTFRTKTNINSTDQLGRVLFEIMGFESPSKTATGKHSTNEASLASVDDPFVVSYLKIKKLQKASGTYLTGLMREVHDGFIHPSFNLHLVKTFRSSSDSPNFQNIPVRDPEIGKLIRRAFVSRLGCVLVEIDYGGIEVKVACCYHEDPTMIRYIEDPSTDMHRDMAMECYMLSREEVTKQIRYCGKNMFIFPQFYGSYWLDCSAHLWLAISQLKLKTASGKCLKEHLAEKGVTELGEQSRKGKPRPGTFEAHIAKVEKDFWGRRFPVYSQWKKDHYEDYQAKGSFLTKTGFICQGYMKRNEAINYPVQGSAFHLLMRALIELQKALEKRGMKAKIVGQVHDSIVADVPEKELPRFLRLAKRVMTKGVLKKNPWVTVPLIIEAEVTPVNGSWVDKQVVEI